MNQPEIFHPPHNPKFDSSSRTIQVHFLQYYMMSTTSDKFCQKIYRLDAHGLEEVEI